MQAQVKEVKARAAAAAEAKASSDASPFGNIMSKLVVHPKFSEWMSDPVRKHRSLGAPTRGEMCAEKR